MAALDGGGNLSFVAGGFGFAEYDFRCIPRST